MPPSARFLLVALLAALSCPSAASAQYFGRNKVQYDDFAFRVVETSHFDVHVYERESEALVVDATRMAERWYERLSRFFGHGFTERKPVLLYANKPDFQQTNAVSGFLSEATGGVTESIKNRLIMPFTSSYAETDHVLGHELVHVFQYDLGRGRDGAGPVAIGRLPLWAIEGLAEYLSLGRSHPHTAMWLRDAVVRDTLPTLDDLTNDPQRYFPYRFGHAFWAWFAGRYGDVALRTFFLTAARGGLEAAARTVQRPLDSLSAEWQRDTRAWYVPLLEGRSGGEAFGQAVLDEGDEGSRIHLGPVLSPDGSRVMFLSQRDLFTFDLYVADATTGEIQARVSSMGSQDPHLEGLAFTQSSGTWAPDGERIAFVTYADGDNRIAVADAATGELLRSYGLGTAEAAYSIAWSPDGATIAVSGSEGGVTDLFLLDVESGALERLTDDPWTELHPDWSPDGRSLLYATDAGDGSDLTALTFAPLGLALLDVATGERRVLRPLPGGDHTNPRFGPEGRRIWFLSDQDGFRDLYRLTLGSGRVERMTLLRTGISGLAGDAPALSVARETERVFFTVFEGGDYIGYAADGSTWAGEEVAGARVAATIPFAGAPRPMARLLPPVETVTAPQWVTEYLHAPSVGLPPPSPDYPSHDYDSDLRLDYVAQPTAGIGVNRFGTTLGGSIAAFFSDMLGNEVLGLAVAAQGDFQDIGGEGIYARQGNRLNWGVTGGRIPFRSGFSQVRDTTVADVGGRVVDLVIDRTFVNRGALFAEYPLGLTRRLEGELGFTRYAFGREIRRTVLAGNVVVDQLELGRPAPDAIHLGSASIAFVEDYSFFGFTSPVRGGRSRFEVQTQLGDIDFTTVLADWRRYVFAAPFTLAVRGLHYGRYGRGSDDTRLSPLFLGQQSFVRGYSVDSFDGRECTVTEGSAACPELDRLVGTRIAVASVEWRAPLNGTEAFGILDWGFVPVELAAFADGGVAWTGDESPEFQLTARSAERIPVFSAGVTSRFNLLGRLVFEIFWAYPFQRPDHGGVFGFHFAPGW